MNHRRTILQLVLVLLAVPGGRKRNESTAQDDDGRPEGDQGTPPRSEEVIDRPDLEIEYQDKRLVIDLDLIEWIALGVIIILGAWFLR